ncbi:hypothetical protein DET61_12063 [Marinobacter nauticus]|uniref:Uncharacterized protein n=1 Tax=Marinobacter nauticus TaxID=2743 RepID=A0A368X4J3_MARNT|nr:hypothetical protein [Marinobacter nauticus]RCW62941.1 hypothetical protein DET61_12063 [Marinobacter nauticus]
MKVQVPFVFEATVIPKGCRKSRGEFVADQVEIEIAELTELKHAATVDKQDYWFDGNSLYLPVQPEANTHGAQIGCEMQSWSLTLADLRNHQSPIGRHNLARYRQAISQYESLPTADQIVQDMPYRSYNDDDRLDQIERLKAALTNYAVYAGRVYLKANEPVYVIQTFGMGRNHGGTGLFVEPYCGANTASHRDRIFNLSNLDKAIEKAEAVAMSRGDDQSVPIAPNSDVTVILPEAFRFEPYSREEYDKGEISLADYLKHNFEPGTESERLIERVAESLVQKMKVASIETQVAWLRERGLHAETILQAYEQNPTDTSE